MRSARRQAVVLLGPRARIIVLTAPFLSVLCGACSGSSATSPSSTTALTVSEATVTFPQVAVGDTATASVTLTAAAAETIGVADTDTADFPYSTNCTTAMAAGASCSITVQFHPSVPGSLAAWLSVDSLSGAKTSVALTGTAVGSPPANPSSSIVLEIETAQPNPFSLAPGQTTQLAAAVVGANGGSQDVTATATWTTSDPTVVTVSPAGLVTAINPGTAGITVTYQGHVASIRVFVASTPTN